MLVPLFPSVTGMKIENAWGRGARGLVSCTARLTRNLRTEESQRITRLLKTSIEGTEVIHECRPEEVDEWHTRLIEALSGAWAPMAVPDPLSADECARPAPPKSNGSGLRRRGQ